MKHLLRRLTPLCLLLVVGASWTGAGGLMAQEPKAPRALVLPAPSSPLVAFRFLLRVGSQDDPKGKEGLAALTAALVASGGTRDLTYDQLLARFYPMATALDGSCHKEVTVFAGVVHRDNLEAFVPLVVSMLTAPRFAPEDFERLRNEAIDLLSKTLRSGADEDLGKATLQLELYRDHPYGHVTAGTVEALKAVTLEDVKAFHRAHYTREALTVGVAGGEGDKVARRVQEALAVMPGGAAGPPDLPEPAMPRGLDVTIVEKPADSTALSLGFPLRVTRREDAFYALAVANSYLGEHRTFNGKLMQDLRGKRGLNYGDYSYLEDFIQEGGSTFPVPNNPRRQQFFSIWVRPVPHDKAVFALRAALWELDRLVNQGMTQAEFEATRNYLLNYSKLWVQTLSRRLGYALDGSFYDKHDLVAELAERLPKLTLEEVNKAVKQHLTAPGFRVAFVTRDAEGLKKALESGAPSPIRYDTQGTPEAVLEEDRAIAAFPLTGVKVRIVPVGAMFEK